MPEAPYFIINCPFCGRDIKEHVLEIAERICNEYPCGSCKNHRDIFAEAKKCWTCNSLHKNFEEKE